MGDALAHTPDCTAQNAATLFGEWLCICAPVGKVKSAVSGVKRVKGVPKPKAVPVPKVPNPCYGATRVPVTVPATHYTLAFPFTPSLPQLTAYANFHKHAIPKARSVDPETGEYASKDTFDDGAIDQLCRQRKRDPLYPLVRGYRILQKARGTYLDKMVAGSPLVGADGRLHDAFRHTPKTLRLAMELLQVLPRPERDLGALAPDDPRRIYDEIRKCFVPAPGHEFVAADFANIEPLLVAYFAQDSAFLRACRTSSHSWFAANVIGRPVDFAQSDEAITAHYAELAAGGPYTVGTGKDAVALPWKRIRDGCKTAGMTSLYNGGPGEIARANPDVFPTRTVAAYYQDAFFALCPKVRAWHYATAEMVERQGYLLAPSGFRLHYNEPFTYTRSEATGLWERKLNKVANEAIAAVPQHTGALYLFTAMRALGRERPDLAECVRLLIHDEVFGEPRGDLADEFAAVLVATMERPHPLMPLDWCSAQERAVMGDYLSVRAEVKRSAVSWGDMR